MHSPVSLQMQAHGTACCILGRELEAVKLGKRREKGGWGGGVRRMERGRRRRTGDGEGEKIR